MTYKKGKNVKKSRNSLGPLIKLPLLCDIFSQREKSESKLSLFQLFSKHTARGGHFYREKKRKKKSKKNDFFKFLAKIVKCGYSGSLWVSPMQLTCWTRSTRMSFNQFQRYFFSAKNRLFENHSPDLIFALQSVVLAGFARV